MPIPRFRRPTLLAALALALVAACSGSPASTDKPVTTSRAKATAKPKATATPTPRTSKPSGEGVAAPSPSPTPSPSPSVDGSATAAASPDAAASPSPSPSPVVAVSAPPIAFPYNTKGATYNYSLAVTLKVLGSDTNVGGTSTCKVTDVLADASKLQSSFLITQAPALFPKSTTPTTFNATVPKNVDNPYALGVVFPKQGSTTTSTVTASAPDHITVAAGSFDTTKYSIVEVVDGEQNQVTLWVDKGGTMIKQVITGDKLPSLIDLSSQPMAASVIKGPVTTTLSLSSVSGVDGAASGPADPAGTGAASPDAGASAP